MSSACPRHPRTVATSTILAAGGTDDGGSPRGQSWPVLPRRNGHIPKVAALLGETTAPPVGPMAAIWKLTGSSLGNPELIVPASPPGPLHLEDANLPALSVGVQIEDVGLGVGNSNGLVDRILDTRRKPRAPLVRLPTLPRVTLARANEGHMTAEVPARIESSNDRIVMSHLRPSVRYMVLDRSVAARC